MTRDSSDLTASRLCERSRLRRAAARLACVGLPVLVWLAATPARAQTFTNLVSFSGRGGAYPGSTPYGDLTLSSTTLYGMTQSGGAGGYGNVFAVGVNGSNFQSLLAFNGSGAGNPNGQDPRGGLALSGTTLYGLTALGGVGDGNLFAVGVNGSYGNLVSFTGSSGTAAGFLPTGNLTLGGTTLYGMTQGEASGYSHVFSVGVNGAGFQNVLSVAGTGGISLALSGTTLYGMTEGGTTGDGGLFSVGITGSGYQSLLSFTGNGGSYPGQTPTGGLTLSGTTLYGMTPYGGSSGMGTVFSVGVDGSNFRSLVSLSGTSGAYVGESPYGSLTLIGTTLYGMTDFGGSSGNGNVFSVGIDGGGYRNLLSFTGSGGAHPGRNPTGDLTASAAATIAFVGSVGATVLSGGTGTVGATFVNLATSSTLYGMTSSGGTGNGSVFSLTVTGANNLNYTFAAAVQSGSAALGTPSPATGSLASGATQSCTLSATSTNLGVNSIVFTASDPNSSNLSQTAMATLTVLDHAAAAFTNGSGTLNLNFGTLQEGSGTQDIQYAIENLPEQYRAGLALTSMNAVSDPLNVFSTDASTFTDLPAGQSSGLFDLFVSTSQVGNFSGQYQFNLSDEQDLSGWAGGQTLVLNVTATVVPEPSTIVLLGIAAAGFIGYRLRRRLAGGSSAVAFGVASGAVAFSVRGTRTLRRAA